MIGVMSFSNGRDERFYRCPKCYNETKHQRIKKNELDFGEILNKEFKRRKA